MRKFIYMVFCSAILFFCLEKSAYANIAPLNVKADGVEPIDTPGVKIESADITVSPEDQGFRFICNYTLKGLEDSDNLTIGIPGDLGYTMEAGYIEDMNVAVNGKKVKYKVYNTTEQLSEEWKNYSSPLHFKWHTFSIPVKKDTSVDISVSYKITWKVLEQVKSYPYNIVPFLLSTDRLFGGSSGTYRIKYINDDNISLPDVKVMISSIMEPNIVSNAILSPTWGTSEINWEINSARDFQDFRLVIVSFKKLVMNFSTGTEIDHSIKWAMLNNNYQRVAELFESIAKRDTYTGLSNEDLGTAAYLASEFYNRVDDYDKALEMLTLPYKTSIWPVSIKYEYLQAMKYKHSENYSLLLDELNKLRQYKDYVLVSGMADREIEVVASIVAKENEKRQQEEIKKSESERARNSLFYYIPSALLILLVVGYIVFRLVKRRKNKGAA
jgi:hypothetical protein